MKIFNFAEYYKDVYFELLIHSTTYCVQHHHEISDSIEFVFITLNSIIIIRFWTSHRMPNSNINLNGD